MYRTLIVDDEQLMRQYLNTNLSAICSNFHVTGIACDGLEALEILKKQEFDLVITDIKMPEMDGLNLAKYIFDSYPRTKVIIISGYNEFEYARLAIKYGVCDYLLKPFSDEGIKETLDKIKKELDYENDKENSMVSFKGYTNYTDSELKSALLSAIIHENNQMTQLLYNLLQERKLSFIDHYSSLMLIGPDELHLLLYEKKILENTSYRVELNQRCTEYCNQQDIAITYDGKGYTIILLTAATEEDLSVKANFLFEAIRRDHWKYDKIKIIASYGCIVSNMMDLSASYSSAAESLALTLKNAASPIASTYYVSQINFLNELKTICNALSTDYISKNRSKTLTDLSLYVSLLQEDTSIAGILRFGAYLIRYLVSQCNIKTDYIYSAFKELTDRIDHEIPGNHFDRDSIHSLFLAVLKVLDHEEALQPLPDTTKIVENAKEYICTHYHEQISLSMVADRLDINPSYLSDLFHKIIGEPYTKFLTRIRMEQALLILRSNPNEKIYKIAEKTGFVSSKHFNSVFKKYYGFTPTEYINKNMK